jgi:MerR family transcriptional regulator, copper efflux regulator
VARDGLLIGEVAARTGVSRKAVRLYEASGILPAPRRIAAGYRLFEPGTEATLAFVTQAQRLGRVSAHRTRLYHDKEVSQWKA